MGLVLDTMECGLPDVVTELQKDPSGEMAVCVIEAMTVNETFFFRDTRPFEVLENNILPELMKVSGGNKIRIWSAASSTGQEPYSIAMVLEENRHKYPQLNYEIIASDINLTVLAKARQGIYNNLEVHRGLPEKYRDKYFKKDGSQWKVEDVIHNKITFQQLNLREHYNLAGPFDFVLLRNVLIYFDREMKEKIIGKIAALMRSKAMLMLGAVECIYSNDQFIRRDEISGLYELK